MPENANSGRYPKLLSAEKSRIIALSARGMSDRDLAREVGRSLGTVQLVIREAGGVACKTNWDPSPARLSAQDREDIRRGLDAGESFRTIAARVQRAPSTVSRELNANGGRKVYAGWRAHRRASEQARRPKIAKLASCDRLRAVMETWLCDELWPPTQISAQLRIDYPHDPMMQVSPETIYQSLYVQSEVVDAPVQGDDCVGEILVESLDDPFLVRAECAQREFADGPGHVAGVSLADSVGQFVLTRTATSSKFSATPRTRRPS